MQAFAAGVTADDAPRHGDALTPELNLQEGRRSWHDQTDGKMPDILFVQSNYWCADATDISCRYGFFLHQVIVKM